MGEYKEVSFWGFASESEGLAAVIGYITLFLAAYEYFRTQSALKVLGSAVFVISVIIVLLFLVEQCFGSLIFLIFDITDKRSGTALLFGNSSNCGSFCAVIAIAAIGFAYCEQNNRLKYIKGFFAGGLILTVITTFSSAAVYGMLFGLVFTFFLILFKTDINKKQGVIFTAVLITPLIVFLLINPKTALKYLGSSFTNSGAYSANNNFDLKDILMEGNILSVSDAENTLIIKAEKDGTFIFSDNNETELMRSSSGITTFEQPFSEITAEISDNIITLDLGYADSVSFAVYNGAFQLIGMNGYLEPELSTSAFPEYSRFYKFGTGRGYIWLNSIPLLKDSVIVGCGAGQFPFYFPQNDIVGTLNTHGNYPLLTDKPHCLYLGIAISYGIPALFVFLAITAISVKGSFIKFRKQSDHISAAILGSILCFLIMGIANDSNPVVSPLFWILLGVSATSENVQEP
ncbi:MAG: O-antigen ligase family protein [Oscillospiraceae bacterium]